MRHITDGELHAYLDDALDLLPEGREEEIQEHLSRCPACRERLQDEEKVRERSGDILTGPDLGALELPTLEELQERAAAPGPGEAREEVRLREEGRTRYRGPLRGMPLAWAATILLALGAGWMGGQIWPSLPQEEGAVGVRGEAGAPGGEEAGVGEAVVLREDVEAGVRPGAGETVDPARVGRGEAPPREAEEDRRQEAALDAGSVDVRGAAAPPAGALGEGAAADVARTRGEEGVLEALVSSRMSAPSLAPQELRVMGDVPALEGMPWALTGAREERKFPESSLAVPGLKVLSVEWEEWLPGERALHIRQLLSVGDTLELRYLGMFMGMEPFEEARAARKAQAQEAGVDRPLSPAVLEASLPPGWNQVEMRWGRGWLVARAPLPEAQIKALLRALR